MRAKTPIPYTKEENENLDKSFNSLYKHIIREKLIKDKDELRLLKSIYELSKEAHKQGRDKNGKPEYQRRKTGDKEPYFSHPIEVAKICSKEMGLRFISTSAALIHDVIEDTYYSKYTKNEILHQLKVKDSDIEKINNVLTVVDGVTKLKASLKNTNSCKSSQVANFKHWIKHAHKPQTLMVKIADRLHNMRTMEHMIENKKLEKAAETTYLYIPIARKLGLSKIIEELENLSLKFRYPERYNELQKHFDKCEKERKEFEKLLKHKLYPVCKDNKLKVKIEVIKKSIYSVYLKMENRKSFYFSNLDKFLPAVSMFKINFIIKDDRGRMPSDMSCWKFYAILSSLFTVKISRLKDWISVPHGLGYRSIHIPIMAREVGAWQGKWIDSRIRTEDMHRSALMGFSAKTSKNKALDYQKKGVLLFLEQLLGDNNQSQTPLASYLDTLSDDQFDEFRNSLNSYEVTVYDATGKPYVIHSKSTVLDFAFRFGKSAFTCNGALINGTPVKLGHQLNNEDQITLFYSKDKYNDYSKMLNRVNTLNAKALILNEINSENGQYVKYEIATCCNPMKGDKIFVHFTNKKIGVIHKTTCIKILCHDGKSVGYEVDRSVKNSKAIPTEEIWKGKNNFQIRLQIEGVNRKGLISDISNVILNYNIVAFKVGDMGSNKHHFIGTLKVVVADLGQQIKLISELDNIKSVDKCYKIEK